MTNDNQKLMEEFAAAVVLSNEDPRLLELAKTVLEGILYGDENKMSLKEVKNILKDFATKYKLSMPFPSAQYDESDWQKRGQLMAWAKQIDAVTPTTPKVLIEFTWRKNGMWVGFHGKKDNLIKVQKIDDVTSSDIKTVFDIVEKSIENQKADATIVNKIKEAALKLIGKIGGGDGVTPDDIKNAKGEVDDAGLTVLLIPKKYMLYLLTAKEIKEYEFGESNNEDLFSAGAGLKLVVVAI